MRLCLFILIALAGCLYGQSVPQGWPLLEHLTKEAPARQVGQQGNLFVDQWAEQTLQHYVERNGGLSSTDYLLSEQAYRKSIEAMMLVEDARYLEEISPSLLQNHGVAAQEGARPSFSRSILLNPTPVFLILCAALLCLIIAWWFQRRPALLWVGGCMALLLMAIAIASALIRDQATGGQASGSGHSGNQFSEAAKALLPAGNRMDKWQRGRMTSYTAAFVPGEARVFSSLSEARLYQLAPNLVEPANLPVDGLKGPIVYAGRGEKFMADDAALKGSIVVMEFDSARTWLTAVETGAQAIIFLGPPAGKTLTSDQALSKMSNSPLSAPRFYMPREEADKLWGPGWEGGLANGQMARLEQKPGSWRRIPINTDWIYIPGGSGADLSELVHVQTYKDAASIVPDLSPGAESAVNLVAITRLLETLSDKPPTRPVLVSIVNDHCNALNGEYVFASFAFTPADVFEDELNRINFLCSQKLLLEKVYSQEPNQTLIEYLRGSIERVGGRSFTVKEPAVNYLAMQRNTLRGEQNLVELQLKDSTLSPQRREESLAHVRDLRRKVDDVVTLMGLFNRFGHQTHFDALTDRDRANLRDLFARLASDASREASLLHEERLSLWKNLELRRQLAAPVGNAAVENLGAFLERAYPVLPSLAAVHLDLGVGSREFGLFYEGEIRPPTPRQSSTSSQAAAQRASRLARLSLQLSDTIAKETGVSSLLQDTVLGAGGLPWQAHQGRRMAFGSSSFGQFARTAVTLSSVADQRPLLFTPSDTLSHIDRASVEKALDWTDKFLSRLISSDRLVQTAQTRGTSLPFAAELTVRKIDQFSVEIPRTILPEALVFGFPKTPLETETAGYVGQVRPFPMLMADGSGRVTLRGELWRDASLLAFGFDSDFSRITAALDLGDSEKRFSSILAVTPRVTFTQRSIVTFECQKTDIIGFTNPLTLEGVPKVDVLDARNDARPRNFSLAGIEPVSIAKRLPLSFNGSASIFLPPQIPFKLRAGSVIAINTTPDDLKGIGLSGGGLVAGLPLIMADDYERLSRSRLDLLASKGVTSDSADAFAKEAKEVLSEAKSSSNPVDRITLTEIARGLAYQSYLKTVETINDLVKAVVLLLALVVPFCFFLVKLLSPFTDVNRQLLLFMGVFGLFTLLLYFIQPAFAVGDRPEVVILAFVILGLAVFVGSVIIGKFDTAMNQSIEQSQLSDSPESPQGRLAGVAFMVGVNNMKRRRIRTTLTCATIVLVTFTILSVISINQDVEPLRLRMSSEAPYDGFVYTQSGLSPISPLRASRLRSHFSDRAETVLRAWTFRQDSYGGYMPYRLTPKIVIPGSEMTALSASILLGLEVGEKNFVKNLEAAEYLAPGGRWFSSNNAREVIISRRSAALLGITPENFRGQMLLCNGQAYELVGLFEDAAWSELRDLRNLPLLPLKMEASGQQASSSEEASTDITQSPGVTMASPLETALFPIDTALGMGFGSYRALAIKYGSSGHLASKATDQLWEDVQRLLRYQEAYLSVGLTRPVSRGQDLAALEPGEYVVASSASAKLGGLLKVAIPIVLAGTIILNTMLGSVMERKKEISIYNAIGLNPSHVMMFFLAEALVFGLVGSVAGYFIGQVLSVTLGQFMAINLNYSSLSVMIVIFLTISTVMLSTLYPASLAARAAVPSGQRKWSLPAPKGDEINIRFPFSYDSRRIFAICAYLNDFMQQNSEASTGKFLSKLQELGKVPSRAKSIAPQVEREALVMIYDVTPIPFDLGVNQRMEVFADYDDQVRAFMLSVCITRESGDKDSWVTVNQPFLEALRKRLLAWRSQRHEVQESYFSAGEKLFGIALTTVKAPEVSI